MAVTRFLSLPAELRVQMYHYLIPTRRTRSDEFNEDGLLKQSARYDMSGAHAARLTCRTMKNELDYELVKLWQEQVRETEVHLLQKINLPAQSGPELATLHPKVKILETFAETRSLRIELPIWLLNEPSY
jgi:hypothetical protein